MTSKEATAHHFKRSATVPTRFQPRARSVSELDSTTVENQPETLYALNSAKIVSFPVPKSPSGSPSFNHAPDTLSWASRSERVLAVGPLQLHRLHGATFISSGTLLLPLLPRSQCWCVDGESKFAMIIQMLVYRIELPAETESEKTSIEEFKDVLSKVCLYEKIACPFRRGFYVDLPEEDPTPKPKKRLSVLERARKWEYDEGWRPEGTPKPQPILPRAVSYQSRLPPEPKLNSPEGSDEDAHSSGTTEDTSTTHQISSSSEPDDESTKRPNQERRFEPNRSANEPPQFTAALSDPFVSTAQNETADSALDSQAALSHAASIQSFHSVTSSASNASSRSASSSRKGYKADHMPKSDASFHDTQNKSSDYVEEAESDPRSTGGVLDATLYQTPSTEEASSSDSGASPPMTPSNSIQAPRRRPPQLSRYRGGGLHATEYTGKLISKACALLLGPPSELFAIMMEIARRLANGAAAQAYRFRVTKSKGRKLGPVPGGWESENESRRSSQDSSNSDERIEVSGANGDRIEARVLDVDDEDLWGSEDEQAPSVGPNKQAGSHEWTAGTAMSE